ncbi:MAG: hypothetical protein PHR84_00235 [Candidatus Omnitrophica bacterium]|jgi:V/A-type H+-transporting ATPase subunit E|nr:hypothetical protein [Candidatus Omnitrophota bacterium]MDD5660935.1 hypothetical protein [Candidatus Omnitrophota bacterium]
MAEEIKELIAKIQTEGIAAAEEKSAQIIAEADTVAQKIIGDAKIEADKVIKQADIEAKRIKESTQASLRQAGRDLLITLRKEINSVLDKLIRADIHRALTAEELALILGSLIKNAPLSLGSEITVSLNQEDKEKLEQGFLKQLVKETQKQITLKSADSIDSGFIISFDAGKSIFDFSADALAEYISETLRPELAKIIKSE